MTLESGKRAGAQGHVKDIWREAKLHQQMLDGCPGPHDFAPIPMGSTINQKQECRICHGILDRISVSWYNKGLEHAKILAQSWSDKAERSSSPPSQ